MISRITVRLRWLRRKFNRTHWSARFLGIEPPKGEADLPGLIVIQIDGLSRTQMERALAGGKLPFLARLIERGHFTLEDFYSGVPSTTPAVQGEVFYGVRAAVPSFEFLRRSTGRMFRMNEAEASAEIEAELEQCGSEPMLKGGCAYSNIYRGGARFSRYCSQDLARDCFIMRLNFFKGLILSIVYAPKILRMAGSVEIRAYLTQVHDIEMPPLQKFPTLAEVEASPVRCPDPLIAEQMIARIKEVRSQGDSVGGAIECRVRGMPVGLGEPVFDRLEADLAKAMLSLPATKGFEVGSGFAGSRMKGSEHNDPFEMRDGQVHTTSNRSGGVQGGISNGEELIFRTAFKPTATILQSQKTVNVKGENTELAARGRHDPCVVPRAVPIVEAMTALVLLDHWMRHSAQNRILKF